MRGKQIASTILVLTLLSFSGCSTVPQPTIEELLSEVNAEHQKVEKGNLDASQYIGELVDYEQRKSYYNKSENAEEYNPEKILTQQQAIEDVNFLFDAFHDCYGPYEYFGGAKVFDIAEEKIKQELKTKKTLTGADLEKILLENLKFIEDGHFKINMKNLNPTKIPFFFCEVAFIKTEEGYQTTDGKKVQSVEGYNNLDELMKRSVSPDGELVYCPVLLKDCEFEKALQSPQNCNETLTVHYTDGKVQKLTAEPYQVYTEFDLENSENNQITEFYKNENIPVFQFNQFAADYAEEILEGATKLKDESVAILDLRSNGGGSPQLVPKWLNEYSSNTVPSNRYVIDTKSGKRENTRKDNWVQNDNLLIILVGKSSGSASELFLDYAYNLENILIVGENTRGALIGSLSTIYLPNSVCEVNIGADGRLCILPEENDYFEELRGFYPDIWVPAGEAEEAAINLINNINNMN